MSCVAIGPGGSSENIGQDDADFDRVYWWTVEPAAAEILRLAKENAALADALKGMPAVVRAAASDERARIRRELLDLDGELRSGDIDRICPE